MGIGRYKAPANDLRRDATRQPGALAWRLRHSRAPKAAPKEGRPFAP
jgi:hypothetical protein